MAGGYIKLWRKTLNSPAWKNITVWRLFEYYLLKACHTVTTLIVGRQEITLQPGQLVTGRAKTAKETGLSEQQIRTANSYLIANQQITIKSTNKFSVITIVNWDTYQATNNEINQQNNQLPNHIQEYKEKKIYKRKESRKKKPDDTPYQAIVDLYHSILCPPCPKVRKLTRKRKQAIHARWTEKKSHQDLEGFWKPYFEEVLNLKWALGYNERKWKANIDWLMREETMVKMSEGVYG